MNSIQFSRNFSFLRVFEIGFLSNYGVSLGTRSVDLTGLKLTDIQLGDSASQVLGLNVFATTSWCEIFLNATTTNNIV